MAMGIIAKEKKEIRWLGLPTNSQHEATVLEEEKRQTIDRIQRKTEQLQDLILQVRYCFNLLNIKFKPVKTMIFT